MVTNQRYLGFPQKHTIQTPKLRVAWMSRVEISSRQNLGKKTVGYTPWKINGWNLQITPIFRKGKSSFHQNLHEDMFQLEDIFPGVFFGAFFFLCAEWDFYLWPKNKVDLGG